MRFPALSQAFRATRLATCAVALTASAAFAAEPGAVLAPAPSPAPDSTLPEIGHIRAVTPFCRTIVDDAAALADSQLADIATTTEALRILAYTPLDRSIFTVRRAVRALEKLSGRLMASRRGEAKLHVAELRTVARGGPGDAPRPDLARFAGSLDGAHAESSHVAHELSRAVTVLGGDGIQPGGMYLPDYQSAGDPRFARAAMPVPFPVDAELESFPPNHLVENGPLHAFAHSLALEVADSLDLMYGSIDEARAVFPTAFNGCTDVDTKPGPETSAAP